MNYISHKYLEDIKAIDNLPCKWNRKDKRQKIWKKQRKIYGFDERDTWCLQDTFYCWLYERLKMFNEINSDNTSDLILMFNKQELSLQQCINGMIKGCEEYFKTDNFFEILKNKNITDVPELFALTIHHLWW